MPSYLSDSAVIAITVVIGFVLDVNIAVIASGTIIVIIARVVTLNALLMLFSVVSFCYC